MPLYTISNPNRYDVVLPFKGTTLKGNTVKTMQLEAHTVDTDEIQFMIRKGLIRVVVANNPSRDDEIEIFPGPHPPGGTLILPPSAADPVGGVAGSQYYNTTINEYLYYDDSRGKWLTKDAESFQVGRNGGTFAGIYYRGGDGLVQGPSLGYGAIMNGTIVGFKYTRTNPNAATFNLVANGVTIATVASAGLAGGSDSLNADFNINDILSVQNDSGGSTTFDVAAWFRVKWRA